MASSRRTATNETINTYGNGTRDYTSLSTWEAATDVDLVATTTSYALECYADSASFNDQIAMAGAVTDASYFRIIRAAAGEGHDGTPGAGVVFSRTGGLSVVIDLNEDYAQAQDLVATYTGNSGGDVIGFRANGRAGVRIVGCIAYNMTNAGAGDGRGFQLSDIGTTEALAINCAAITCDGEGFTAAGGTVMGYNCTAADCTTGFFGQTGAFISINCLGASNTTDFNAGASGSHEYNASSDGTAPGSNSRTSQTFTFVDASGDDYHLADTDAGGRGFGRSCFADATFAFDDDIDGRGRAHPWSIGMHEYTHSARVVGLNENISTYGNGTRDYTSLATWEAATDNDLVTLQQSEVLECYADSATFDDNLVASGTIANLDYYRIIRAADGNKHNGIPGDGVVFEKSTTHVFNLNEDYFSLQDIEVNTTFGAGSLAGVLCNSSGSDGQRLVGVIAKATGSGNAYGFWFTGTLSEPLVAVDCLAYACKNEGFNIQGGNQYYYNCTSVDNGGWGFSSISSDDHLINCLGSGNTSGDFNVPISAGSATKNNASSDATAPGSSSRTSQTFTFVDDAANNYHLSTDDAGAAGFGVSLTANSEFAFLDDVDGTTWSPWSMGFASTSASAATAALMTWMRRRRRF